MDSGNFLAKYWALVLPETKIGRRGKVKCTSNEMFRIRPPVFALKPGEETVVKLTFNAGKTVPDSGKHYFAVYYIKATDENKAPRACWSDHKGDPNGTKRLYVDFKKEEGDEKKEEAEKKEEEKKEGEEKKEAEEKKEEERKEEKKEEKRDEKEEEKKTGVLQKEDKKEEKKEDEKKEEKKEDEKKEEKK
uniref:Major sperm protein n=1 Tax=Brugia malayi TaxID=6279 RepID=A0A0H5SDU7_BRUMA|nr:Bm8178 [Brugia malayi]